MFVATFNYDLFQRTDVLCAAESPDALRLALKDSDEQGVNNATMIYDSTIK